MIRQFPTQPLVFGATDQVKSFHIHENGDITDFLLVIPNFTTAATLVFTVTDKDGHPWFTSTAITKNQTLRVTPTEKIPVDNDFVVTVTLNDVAGGSGGTVTVKAAVEARNKG